jgi:hypothetical protein
LGERLGLEPTLQIWGRTFDGYQDTTLQDILSGDWKIVATEDTQPVSDQMDELVDEMLLTTNLKLSPEAVRNIIGFAPPNSQIQQKFSTQTVQREITAYEWLHLRFDGLALLAEALIQAYGKQGELIVYDLQIETRLAAEGGGRGSVEQFIAQFTAAQKIPSLFSAGLESEVVSASKREARMHIHHCEWARYFQERHPQVGYLMACSSDEAAYKTFNENLRMQRTQTLMEGGEYCDFYIYAVENPVLKYKTQWKRGE